MWHGVACGAWCLAWREAEEAGAAGCSAGRAKHIVAAVERSVAHVLAEARKNLYCFCYVDGIRSVEVDADFCSSGKRGLRGIEFRSWKNGLFIDGKMINL